MNDSFGVRSVESIRELDGDVEQAVRRQRTGEQLLVEVLSLEQFHRDERLLVTVRSLPFLHRVDGANVGMVQSRGRAGFEQKTVERILLARDLRRQEFERDFAAQS